jgi:hypothetical protein
MGKEPRKHCVLPDIQNGPERPTDHLRWAGNYIAAKRPDVIVQIGDWGDWASLSSYDRGKRDAEGRRVTKDWDAFRRSVEVLEKPFAKIRGYRPRKIFTEGNHEVRIKRYANECPAIDVLPDPMGFLGERGWEAYPFLTPVNVDGIRYCHLFARTSTGKVTPSSQKFGAANAIAQVRGNMVSCTAGHKPGFDYAEVNVEDRTLHGLIAGSFYTHHEDYQTVQGNRYFKGLVMKHRVVNGTYDVCKVGIDFLRERYGK